MLSQSLQRKMVSEKMGLPLAQAVVFTGAILIVGYAFIRMAMRPLTEVQWLIGLATVTGLVLQCMILVALIDLKRKWAEAADAANAPLPPR